MTDTISFAAEARDRAGKGGAREARRQGRIPAIVYGDKREPMMISLDHAAVVQQMKRPGFLAHVFEIDLGGRTERVLPREVQYDPVSGVPLHLDLLRFGATTRIHVDVEIDFDNEDKAPGLKKGMLNVVMRSVEVICTPDSIPERLSVDLSGLDIGDVVHIGAIKLPAGVELAITDADATVASITAPAGEEVEAAGAAEDTEGAA